MSKTKKCGCPSEEEQAKIVKESMKKYGFYIHYIFNGEVINFHTHGLVESFNHVDFQIAFNIPPDVAMSIMHTIVDKLRKGKRFKGGDIVEEVIANGYNVKLWQTVECGRPVLRLLLPDKVGRFPDEAECAEAYKVQMKVDKF